MRLFSYPSPRRKPESRNRKASINHRSEQYRQTLTALRITSLCPLELLRCFCSIVFAAVRGKHRGKSALHASNR